MDILSVFPADGANMDLHASAVSDKQAIYLKNVMEELNRNVSGSHDGGNIFALTPLQSLTLYQNLNLPDGENSTVGYKEYKEKNQGFLFVYNSNNTHTIFRLDGITGVINKVYQKSYLNLNLDPKNWIKDFRAVIKSNRRVNLISNNYEEVTELYFTTMSDEVHFIIVEDAIATNSFDATVYPFFTNNDADFDASYLINLGLAQPAVPITYTPIAFVTGDDLKSNDITSRGIQFRARFTDFWGRQSDFGPVSDMFINTSRTVRGLLLKIPCGSAIVETVELCIRIWTQNIKGLSTVSDWYTFDVINKYDNTTGVNWFERPFLTALNYSTLNNTIDYNFYNDKGIVPINVADTNRNFNPLTKSASSIFTLNKAIGVANLKKGFTKMKDSELNKLNFTVTTPSSTPNCDKVVSKHLQFWGMIWNPYDIKPVYIRKHDTSIVFGSADRYSSLHENNPFIYDQVLPQDQEGIIAYLVGTKKYSVSKQYRWDVVTDTKEYVGTVWDDLGDGGRYIPLQLWEFDITPGEYIFRVSSHKSVPTDNYEKTSTRIRGHMAPTALGGLTDEFVEIKISYCDGVLTFSTTDYTYIMDMSRNGNGGVTSDRACALEGYLYEDEVNKLPVEMAIVADNESSSLKSKYTDHNGYYFIGNRGKGLTGQLFGTKGGLNNQLLATTATAYDSAGSLHRPNTLYVYKGLTTYPLGDRWYARGTVTDCNSVPLAGVLVMMTRGAYAITGSDGKFQIAAHLIGDSINTRTEILIFGQTGVITIIQCIDGDCKYCNLHLLVISPPYVNSTTGRYFDVTPAHWKVKNLNATGPHSAAKYLIGIIRHDWLGRESYGQREDKHFVITPSVEEKGTFSFSVINFDMTGIVFEPWVKRVSFCITNNQLEDDYLTWAAEKVLFVDATGTENKITPTAIRLYYNGLSQYNLQNNESTTTNWQFLVEQTGLPIEGDQIEFIANGDGSIFPTRVKRLVTYDKAGEYIQVEYTSDLASLTDNTLTRFIRTKKSELQQFYYELPLQIKVTSGTPAIVTGTLPLKDAYLLNRQIPVPVTTKMTDSDGNVTETTNNELRTFPYPFEHHSPSDLWGDHCWNKGRVTTVNPYEKENIYRTGIDVSGERNSNSALNFLSYFNDALSYDYDDQEWGGIVACFPEVNQLFIVLETDNIILPFSSTRLQMNSDNSISAESANQFFGRPNKKVGSNFGCQFKDLNTIVREQGLICFVDARNSALVVSDFTQSVDISVKAGVKGWLTAKIKDMLNYNNGGSYVWYFHSGFDIKRNLLLLTDHRTDNTIHYNDSPVPDTSLFETMSFDIQMQQFKGALAFNPEFYGQLHGDKNANQVISFCKGSSWFHYDYRNSATDFNKVYGGPLSTLHTGFVGNVLTANVWAFTLTGTVNAYDIVRVDYTFDTVNYSVTSVVQPGWNLGNLVSDLLSRMATLSGHSVTYTDGSGNNGVKVTGTSTASGTVTIKKVPQLIQTTPWITLCFNQQREIKKLWQAKNVLSTKLLYCDFVKSANGQVSRIMPLWWQQNRKGWSADFKCALNTYIDSNVPDLATDNIILEGDLLNGEWIICRYRPTDANRANYFEVIGFETLYLPELVK